MDVCTHNALSFLLEELLALGPPAEADGRAETQLVDTILQISLNFFRGSVVLGRCSLGFLMKFDIECITNHGWTYIF